MLDKQRLMGRIIERGYTQKRLAEELGISRTCFNLKLNGKLNRVLTLREAQQIMEKLSISDPLEIGAIFFAPSVAAAQQNAGGAE